MTSGAAESHPALLERFLYTLLLTLLPALVKAEGFTHAKQRQKIMSREI